MSIGNDTIHIKAVCHFKGSGSFFLHELNYRLDYKGCTYMTYKVLKDFPKLNEIMQQLQIKFMYPVYEEQLKKRAL